MTLDRRTFLTALGAVAGSAALGGCGARDATAGEDLTFAFLGGGAELAAFSALARDFEAAEGVRVRLQPVRWGRGRPATEAARTPDVVRLPYTDLAAWSSRGALLDLTGRLPAADADRFLPAPWRAASPAGTTVGVPHTLDTSVLLVRTDAATGAGVALPPSPQEAWTWEQLDEALVRLGDVTRGRQSATGVNWQRAGAHRWLNFLGQSGGRLLTADLSASAVAGPAGGAALRWTQSLFTRGLVPPTTSTGGTDVAALFARGDLASVFAAGSRLPALTGTGIEFGATALPRNPGVAAELGGAAVAVTAGTPRAEQAARFLRFLAGPEQMGRFCAATGALPTRSDVGLTDLEPTLRPDLVELLEAQTAGITADVVAQSTVPAFPALNAVLGEQLERAFVHGADAGRVLEDLDAGIARVLRGAPGGARSLGIEGIATTGLV